MEAPTPAAEGTPPVLQFSEDARVRYQEYALKYFTYSAEQRMKSFNFYILLVSANIAGAATLIAKTGTLVSPFVAILGLALFLISILFLLLDFRCKELINYGIGTLKAIEEQDVLARRIPMQFTIFARDGKPTAAMPGKLVSYRFILPIFISLFGGLGFAVFLLCVI